MTKLTKGEQWGLRLSHRQNNAWSSCSVFGLMNVYVQYLGPFSVNWRCLWCWGNPRRSPAVCELIRPAAPTTNNHVHHVQSHFSRLSSSFWCLLWTSASCLHHVYMPRCTALLPCDRRITCVSKQLNILPHKEASECMWNLHKSREAGAERMSEREVKSVLSAKLQLLNWKFPLEDVLVCRMRPINSLIPEQPLV